MELSKYIEETKPEFKKIILKYISEFKRGIKSHPSKQKEENGLELHTLQVIKKALELNQVLNRREIIETCLAHDLKKWEKLPLNPRQTTAILATKGLSWDIWRKKTNCHKLVVLILIADMWSAYLNEKDL